MFRTRQHPHSSSRSRLVAVSFVALVVLGSAGPASARTSNAGADLPGRVVSAAESSRTARFDMRSIMRTAVSPSLPELPLKLSTDLPSQGPEGNAELNAGTTPARSSTSGSPTDTANADATLASVQNGAWGGAYNRNPNAQIGKLFYDVDPRPNVEVWNHCTATVVNSENKSTVVTAGHCVFDPDPDGNGRVDGNGYWFEHLQFCPGFEFGCGLGKWRAQEIYTTANWFYGYGSAHAYDWRDDVAMIVMKPHATKGRIADAVGSQGIAFNQNTSLVRHAFGYPITDSRWPGYVYSGKDLIYCRARDSYQGHGLMAMACTMTGGSSGGPWLISPNASWGGYVNSVNSHKAWGGAYMGGPYFGNAERALFNFIRAR